MHHCCFWRVGYGAMARPLPAIARKPSPRGTKFSTSSGRSVPEGRARGWFTSKARLDGGLFTEPASGLTSKRLLKQQRLEGSPWEPEKVSLHWEFQPI